MMIQYQLIIQTRNRKKNVVYKITIDKQLSIEM